MNHFGEHLTIDGYNGSLESLNNKDLVLGALQELPDILGMHTLSKAQVFEAEGNEKKDPGGWSGYVIIMESHISLHTFPKRGFLSADVYTCQNGLDTETIVEYFKKSFLLKEVETHFLIRGSKYPENNIY